LFGKGTPISNAFENENGIESDEVDSPTRRRLTVDLSGTKEGGLGMVIVGGYKDGKQFGIFVKSIRESGPVFRDGRIRIGDQLLSANGKSLRGISNDQAVQSLKQCALTDHVDLEIVRDVTSRSNFKRLSQVMNFNPGETPPEMRNIRHTVIPTMDEDAATSSSRSSSLPSVSDVSEGGGGDNDFRSSSTPAVLEEEIREALKKFDNPVSSSLQELGYYREKKDSESPPSPGKNISATDVKVSMASSPHKVADSQEENIVTEENGEDVDGDNPPQPPLPTTQPPADDEMTPPPLPVSGPPTDEDSDGSQAPSLPGTRPPEESAGLNLSKETSFNKRLTLLFPKVLGIGITVKGGTNMPSGPGVYIDKVIRGLDAAKVMQTSSKFACFGNSPHIMLL
jgi:hypothetical protein